MNCNGKENKMADEKRIENTAKQMEIVLLRKMGIDVVLDKDEFNRVLKANEKVQKMEMDLSELSKLNSELKELKIEKQAVEENKQKLKNANIAQGKQNFAEFIEAVKALKDFIPASKEFSPELRLSTRHEPYWYDINRVKIPVDNSLDKTKDIDFYDITKGKVLFVAKRMDDSIVCITKGNTNDAQIYYDENTGFVDEKNKPWYLYEKFADSNHIIELKTAIKESLENRIGKTKEQLNQAHKELHEAEKTVQKKNLLINEPDDESKVLEKFKNGINISPDEFLELSRSLDSKNFELLANKIQAGTTEYWTNMACIQIEEYNTNQLKWILENREVRFDEVERSYSLNIQQDEIKKTLNLPQWAAVSDDPETIDIVFSKMTEKDFKWAKENGVFKIAEDFYKDKNENFSFSFETLKDWVKKYDPDYSNDKIVRHFYARQVPPEDQSYPIDEELENLEISIIESYSGSRYSEIINNDIPNGSMEKFGDTMNEISDDFDSYFNKGVNPSDEDLESGKAQYASLEEAVNTELPKKDGSKYTEEEMKEWHDVFERYGKAGDRGHYWSTTEATHEVLSQVMELQTGKAFVLASLKGSSQGEDVTAVIPEELYSKDAVENLEAKYWNEGVEYLVYEDDSGKELTQEEIKKHLDENSVDYYVPSYKSAEKLAQILGARKGELTVYNFDGWQKSPKYEKIQYMKTLSNPLDDLRTVLKAYEHGFDNDYKLDEYDKNRVSKGKWSIATGGYDLAWEVYYENVPVASCGTDHNLVGNNNNSFTGFTEADMLRVITQEYKNVKCPEIEIPTVEDYEQYLNDYFHDGSFTLEPENSFDEYPFENLLNENLNRHFHYEKDFAGGVILSYDYSNHTEYLQPGDDANKFLEEAEKIENGILQVNATEQLDNLIGFYFPDFFPEDYHEENTKRFITRKEIVDAVNNYECGKLYREFDPEGFAEDAQEWIEQNSPVFTDVSTKTSAEGQISNGQVLGFVKDNKIYINIDSFNAETPIHEYTHLWDKAIQKTNPELWKQGVELLKKTDIWKEIERNPDYADIAGDEDLLASEVHARLVGKEGSELFRNVADEVTKTVGSELQNLRRELAEEFCSNKINVVQPYHDDLKRIKDSDFIGINFEVSAKEWTPIRIQLYCEEICDKLGLEYIDAASNYPREEGHVLSNDTYFVNLSVGGFRKFPLQHYISSDEIKLAAYKWNEDSWNYVRDNFTEWKGRDSQSIKDMSVSDFVNITLKDFVDGKNPVSYISTEEKKEQENIQMQYERKTHNEYTLMSNYGYGWEQEPAWGHYNDAKQGLKEYREHGGGSYYLKHHTRVPNGFCVTDGHYVPEEDITPENFKTYFKAALKLRQIAGNPQKAAAYCFKHANMPSKLNEWFKKQGCSNPDKFNKLIEKWAKENIKPVQTKTKTKSNSREDESWSISD